MVVYYAMTKFHLLFCLTHRILHCKDDDTVLILYYGLSDVDQYQKKISEKKIFSQVLIINEIEMRSSWKGVRDISDEKTINYNIECINHSVKNWLPFRLEDANEIYLTNDHWALGIYCIYNKIPYYFYEDGVGMLSKPDYSFELVFKLNKTQARLAKYIGAFANNDNVIAKFADLKNQSSGFYDEKAKHYSVTDSLMKISSENRIDILDIFGMKQIHIEGENLSVLFTEHFVNMKRLTITQQCELYALIVDYFANGYDLIIKPHPNDIHVNYKEIFPKAKLIDKNFPSELLPYCVDKKLNYGIAACSTAVLGLKDFFDSIIRFNVDIENKYFQFHKYYALSQLIKILEITHCDVCGIEQDIYDNFTRINNFQSSCLTENSAMIFDKIDNSYLSHNYDITQYDCVIFLSLFNHFDDYQEIIDKLDKKNFLFLKIEKLKDDDTYLLNDHNEYILV